MNKEQDNSLDARECKYPCAACKKRNTRRCHGTLCPDWKTWYHAKWPEVVGSVTGNSKGECNGK